MYRLFYIYVEIIDRWIDSVVDESIAKKKLMKLKIKLNEELSNGCNFLSVFWGKEFLNRQIQIIFEELHIKLD